MTTTTRLMILLLAQASSASSQLPRVSDSAGVRIVSNPSASAALPVIRISSAPFLDLGGLGDKPDEELSTRTPYFRILRLSNGTIAINDDERIKFFSASGKLLRVVGRKGGGPGEFSSLDDICKLSGDTIVAISRVDHRITMFASNGDLVRTTPIPGNVQVPYGGCFGDGTMVVQVGSTRGGSTLDPIADFARLSTRGAILNTLGTWPASVGLGLPREVSISAHGREVFVADAKRSEVREYNGATGKLVRVIRTADEPARYTDADYERAIRNSIPGAVTEASIRQARERMDRWPRPATWPVYHWMFVDPAGRIWLAEYPRGRLFPEHWFVIAADGTLLGRLAFPDQAGQERWHLTGAESDQIIVSRRDGDGATHLSFYRVVFPRH